MADKNDGTEIAVSDVKNPISFLEKFGLGALAGVGGIGGEMALNTIKSVVPQAELAAFLTWMASALLKGAINNKYAENLLAGSSAVAAVDLVKSLYARFKGSKIATTTTLSSGNATYTQPYQSNELF